MSYLQNLTTEKKECYCSICQSLCIEEESDAPWDGHYRYYCPNGDKEWHATAALLYYEFERTNSPSIKGIIRKDIDDILKNNTENVNQ